MKTKLVMSDGNGKALFDLSNNFNWRNTSIGDYEYWSATMKSFVNTCLLSRTPVSTLWGDDMLQIYNEAYGSIIGLKHPEAFGSRADETWGEIWPEIGPLLKGVLHEGKSFQLEDHPFTINRNGHPEECYFTFSYSPIYNDEKKVEGILVLVKEMSGLSEKISKEHERLQADMLQKLVEERTMKLYERNEELKRSEERYHKMIEEVQDYAIILLDENGTIENWNTGAQKIKGYNSEEITGKNFRIFYTKEDQEKRLPEQLLNEATINGKAIHEGWRVRKDGSKFWGSIVITALHDSQNKIIGFSKVTRDLTERKFAEDKMKEYLFGLEIQNKELEQFAYVASHDLQEPLRKIQTFTEVIQNNPGQELIMSKYFDKINLSAKRMSELIKSVLNYSRLTKESEMTVETDLNVVIDNIKADYELLIEEKNATIHCEPLPVINAISLQINQLFSNLIGNALKFTHHQPVISITSRTLPAEQILHKPLNIAPGNYLEISVADNGIGFDQKYEQVIFAMFKRLHGKQEFSGTGIGLALCKKIMECHGGFITAESELNKGATFKVYFPVDV